MLTHKFSAIKKCVPVSFKTDTVDGRYVPDINKSLYGTHLRHVAQVAAGWVSYFKVVSVNLLGAVLFTLMINMSMSFWTLSTD